MNNDFKDRLDRLIKRLFVCMMTIWSFVVIWAVTMTLHYEVSEKAAIWFGFALWILLGIPTGCYIMCLLMSLAIPDNGKKGTCHKNTYTSPEVIKQRGILGSITCPFGNGSYPEGERHHHKNDAYNHKGDCPTLHSPNPFARVYRLLTSLSTKSERYHNMSVKENKKWLKLLLRGK